MTLLGRRVLIESADGSKHRGTVVDTALSPNCLAVAVVNDMVVTFHSITPTGSVIRILKESEISDDPDEGGQRK